MQKRVLLVDNDPSTVQLVTVAFRTEGFEVEAAGNGPECLLSVAQRQPDLIVLDVKMPVMDGFQTLRVLRENAATREIPVIILSICPKDRDVTKGLSGGADLYLTKPFEVAALVTAVRRMLQVAGLDEAPP